MLGTAEIVQAASFFTRFKLGIFRGCATFDPRQNSAEIIDVWRENALQRARFGRVGRNVIRENNSL